MKEVRNNFRKKLRLFRQLLFSLLFLMLVSVALLFLGQMEDSVRGRGVFSGIQEYQMRSAVRSRISQILHEDGDRVKQGEVLLRLDDRDLREKITLLENTILELQAEIRVKATALSILRRDPLPRDYRHTEIALSEYLTRFKKSSQELAVYKGLLAKKVISNMEFQRKELEHLKIEAELKRIKNDYAKLADGLAAKIIGKAEGELKLLKLCLQGKRRELDLCKLRLSDYVFVAPENGFISHIPSKPGGYVEPGDILIKLSSAGKKKFTAYIDEKYIYKIREQQTVRIISSQYNYFDHGYFEGKVHDIGELPVSRGARNVYPVKIILTKEPHPLRLGSTGEAWIVTGREKIIYALTGWRH